MKRFSAEKIIEEAMSEILKGEIRNVFASTGDETSEQQRERLATGFDRINAFETMALQVAAEKFE